MKLKNILSSLVLIGIWLIMGTFTIAPAQAQSQGAPCSQPGATSTSPGLTCVVIPADITVAGIPYSAGTKWVQTAVLNELAAALAAANGGGAPGAAGQLDILTEAAGTLPGLPAGFSADAPASAAFGGWIARLLNIILVLAVLIVFLFLIWGGFEWITSGGDKGKLESARNRITQAVIGLIVLAASTAILILVQDLLNICVIQIGTSCTNWAQ